VYGLQASGLEVGEALPRSIGEMAEQYLQSIRAVRPHGPYHLLGWSFGGIVAHAIASRLRKAGETVALLALLDTAAPQSGGAPPDDGTVMAELAKTLALAGPGTIPTSPTDNIADLTRIVRDSGMFPSDFTPAQTERLLALYELTVRLPLGHRPEHFDGTAHLFVAQDSSDAQQLAGSWAPFVGDTVMTPIPCSHERMTAPKAAKDIAAVLAELIRSEIPPPDEQLVAAK
jgi:thioesterase domain-containing protein